MRSCESTHWTLHTYHICTRCSTSTSIVQISKPLNSICLLHWTYFFFHDDSWVSKLVKWFMLHTFIHSVIQENHFSLLQHETEKLRSDIEKMRSELRLAFTNYIFLLPHISSISWRACFEICNFFLVSLLGYCRYEIDKVSAGHRLDLNLERG